MKKRILSLLLIIVISLTTVVFAQAATDTAFIDTDAYNQLAEQYAVTKNTGRPLKGAGNSAAFNAMKNAIVSKGEYVSSSSSYMYAAYSSNGLGFAYFYNTDMSEICLFTTNSSDSITSSTAIWLDSSLDGSYDWVTIITGIGSQITARGTVTSSYDIGDTLYSSSYDGESALKETVMSLANTMVAGIIEYFPIGLNQLGISQYHFADFNLNEYAICISSHSYGSYSSNGDGTKTRSCSECFHKQTVADSSGGSGSSGTGGNDTPAQAPQPFTDLLNFLKAHGVGSGTGSYKYTPNTNTPDFTISTPNAQSEIACNLKSKSGSLEATCILTINNKLDGAYGYTCMVSYGSLYMIINGEIPVGYKLGDTVPVTYNTNMTSQASKDTALKLANTGLETIIKMFAASLGLISTNYSSFPDYHISDYGFNEFVICTDGSHTNSKFFDGPDGLKYTYCDDCYKRSTIEVGNNEVSPGHFIATQEGTQQPESTTTLYSLWKNTRGYLSDYRNNGYVLDPYEIQLIEMYTGDTAAEIVEDYNHYNEDPASDEQWILMKFRIKNNGGVTIEGSDILGNSEYSEQFYTKDGVLIDIIDCAVVEGNDIYDDILPGTSAEIQMAVLVKKSVGYPCIYIPIDYENYNEVYAKTTIDPDYVLSESAPTPTPTPDPNPAPTPDPAPTPEEKPVEIVDTTRIFTDIKTGKWYTNAVNYAYTYGFIAGVSKTEFGRDVPVTRGMFITILARIAGVNTSGSANKVSTKFTDVKSGKYYTAAIKWGNEAGIVSGVSNTSFAPNDAITREQLCVMITGFASYMGISLIPNEAQISFKDNASISKWAKTAVQKCQRADIVNGYSVSGGTDFRPKNTATRAEAAQILYKFHKDFVA